MKDHHEQETGADLTVVPEKSKIPAFFEKDGGIEELVSLIEKEALAVHQNYETNKGRKAARSLARKVSSSKTAIDEVGKEMTVEWRRKVDAVNAKRKLATERLDDLRDKIKGPADEYEKREADRVAAHMTALDQFDQEALSAHSTSADLNAKIDAIEAVEIGPAWEEFEGEAREKKAAALTKFRSDLAVAEDREAKELELEELRREKAEREAKEAAEREAKEAEAREKAAREDQERQQIEAAERAAKEAEEKAAREVQEAKDAAARAEREAEERAEAAAQAERERIEEERRKAAEEEVKRKADATHRAKIRGEIVQAFIDLNPDGWETAVDAMIDGKIQHVKVNL